MPRTLPIDHPMLRAWEAFRADAQTRWDAGQPERVEIALWKAFEAGYNANQGGYVPPGCSRWGEACLKWDGLVSDRAHWLSGVTLLVPSEK